MIQDAPNITPHIPGSITDIGIALLIIFYLIRDFVTPLLLNKKRNCNNSDHDKIDIALQSISQTLDKLTRLWEKNQSKVDDLHEWHKPDHNGVQTWKHKQ